MRIIIVGNGKVGYTIAENLIEEHHDIVFVDKDEMALRRADETMDVMCIKGNGACKSVLLEAGIQETDILIAVTSRDEINMICCLTAKRLGKVRTIARIREPEYFEEFTDLREDMGIDMIINPEYSAAMEIANILQFPSAMNVESFFGGRVLIAEFRLLASDFMVDNKLSKISGKLPKNLLIAVVERKGEAIIPDGNFEFKDGDKIFAIGQLSGITNLFKSLGHYVDRIHSVMIAGGGRITYYLAKIIAKLGMLTKIIEIDVNKCLHLSEILNDAMIIEGDGTNPALLESENIEDTDAFITMTGRDEENLITAMFALEMGVQKVIAMTSRVNMPGIINKLGLDSVISPKMVTANNIIAYVRGIQNSRGSFVEALYKIVDGKAEIISFIASKNTKFLDIPLKELKTKKDVLVTCIYHLNIMIIPHGNEKIQLGDKVLVIASSKHVLMDLNDIME